jgi:hypothetical protein
MLQPWRRFRYSYKRRFLIAACFILPLSLICSNVDEATNLSPSWEAASCSAAQKPGPFLRSRQLLSCSKHEPFLRSRQLFNCSKTWALLKKTQIVELLKTWALLKKPPVVQLLKNFPAFYGTRRFITTFRVPILSQMNPVYSTPSCL